MGRRRCEKALRIVEHDAENKARIPIFRLAGRLQVCAEKRGENPCLVLTMVRRCIPVHDEFTMSSR